MWAAPAFVYAGLELYKGSKASKGKRQARRKRMNGESSNPARAAWFICVYLIPTPLPHTHTHTSC